MSGIRLANDSWESLLAAQAAMMRGFASERMWDEVSLHDYDVLYALKKAGCALRQTDLNTSVLLSQPALSRLLERLEQRGLVARAPDPADRRAVLVTLTEAGRAAQRATGTRHARSVEERMRVLSPAQQEQLRDLCDALTAAATTTDDPGTGQEGTAR